MKKLSLFLTLAVMALSASAQANANRIMIGGGALYERGVDATVAWEHETNYHNAWEFYANGYLKWDICPSCGYVCKESFWHNYRTWGLGVAYKPCVWRSRNEHGNLRLGASCGSNTHDVLAGLHVGYEQHWALRSGWAIYCQIKCDIMLPNRQDLFREGLCVGVKLPNF